MPHILLIEDNPENLDLMSYLLRAFGHFVTTATNGADGLRVASEQRPELILCDIHMPGMSGVDVARQLKGNPELASIPLVAVTAYAMVGDREQILASGFEAYLSKPIEPENFVSQIEASLRKGDESMARAVPLSSAESKRSNL